MSQTKKTLIKITWINLSNWKKEVGLAIKRRLLLPAPLRFFPAPHNFLNPKTGLDLLFEKGTGLLKIGIWECATDSSIQN